MVGFIAKYIKKIKNMFHIPGEDVIIIGFDDRSQSVRIYDLFVKTGPQFKSNMESKVLEQNVARIYTWFPRVKLAHEFVGEYLNPARPNELTVSFTIDKSQGDIFKTDDKPEGIAYLFDMQTGQGATLIRKEKQVSLEEGVPDTTTETVSKAGSDLMFITVPQQIRLHRDPVIDMLFSVNPYFWGNAIDSIMGGELLRGKVEMWKTVVIALILGLLGWMVGLGM